jgi:hypothetical protein
MAGDKDNCRVGSSFTEFGRAYPDRFTICSTFASGFRSMIKGETDSPFNFQAL